MYGVYTCKYRLFFNLTNLKCKSNVLLYYFDIINPDAY